MTHDKSGQSCTLFSKPRVCQSLFKMPNPARQSLFKMPNPAPPLFPLPGQVWLQLPLMRAVGTRGLSSMHSLSFQ